MPATKIAVEPLFMRPAVLIAFIPDSIMRSVFFSNGIESEHTPLVIERLLQTDNPGVRAITVFSGRNLDRYIAVEPLLVKTAMIGFLTSSAIW